MIAEPQKLADVQAIAMSQAQVCLDCDSISNTKTNNCPACGSIAIWNLQQWLERKK